MLGDVKVVNFYYYFQLSIYLEIISKAEIMSVRDLKNIESDNAEQTEFLRNGKPRPSDVLNSTSAPGSNPSFTAPGMSTIVAPTEEPEIHQGEKHSTTQPDSNPLPRTSEDDFTDHNIVKKVLEDLKKRNIWYRDKLKTEKDFHLKIDTYFSSFESDIKDFITKLLIVSDRSHFYNSTIKQANKLKTDLKKIKTDLWNDVETIETPIPSTDPPLDSDDHQKHKSTSDQLTVIR